MLPKCPITSDEDFAVWYTPGVAAPCRRGRRAPAHEQAELSTELRAYFGQDAGYFILLMAMQHTAIARAYAGTAFRAAQTCR